jgi:hypothetical protein
MMLLATAPRVEDSAAPIPLMFLYFGLPLGSATAGLAGLGFLVGGVWARIAGSDELANHQLTRVKLTALSLIVLPLAGVALYLAAAGLCSGRVQVLGRNSKLFASWTSEPLWFLVNTVGWGAIGVTIIVAIALKLRAAYAPQPRRSSEPLS